MTWISIGVINSSRTIYLPSLKLLGAKRSWVISCTRWSRLTWPLTLTFDLWPTDLNINRGHLLIKDYLPTKFEASGAKHCWVISCTRWSRLARPLTLTFGLLTWISIGVIYSEMLSKVDSETLSKVSVKSRHQKFQSKVDTECFSQKLTAKVSVKSWQRDSMQKLSARWRCGIVNK